METRHQGRTQEGADGGKALPEIPRKNIYLFKSGAFYVSQFVQRSLFHNHFITIVYIDQDTELLKRDIRCVAGAGLLMRVTYLLLTT